MTTFGCDVTFPTSPTALPSSQEKTTEGYERKKSVIVVSLSTQTLNTGSEATKNQKPKL